MHTPSAASTNKERALSQLLVYRWPDLFRLAGLVALYALITEMTMRLFSVDGTVILIWPGCWLALSVILIGRKEY